MNKNWTVKSVESIGGPVLSPAGQLDVPFHACVENGSTQKLIGVAVAAKHGTTTSVMDVKLELQARLNGGWEPADIRLENLHRSH